MAEIHRRTGILVSTLGDLEKLAQAARADGFDADDRLTSKSVYLYFDRGQPAEEEAHPEFTGKCGQCMRPNVPANADGVALKHNIGDTDHSGACRGSGSRVTGLRRHR